MRGFIVKTKLEKSLGRRNRNPSKNVRLGNSKSGWSCFRSLPPSSSFLLLPPSFLRTVEQKQCLEKRQNAHRTWGYDLSLCSNLVKEFTVKRTTLRNVKSSYAFHMDEVRAKAAIAQWKSYYKTFAIVRLNPRLSCPRCVASVLFVCVHSQNWELVDMSYYNRKTSETTRIQEEAKESSKCWKWQNDQMMMKMMAPHWKRGPTNRMYCYFTNKPGTGRRKTVGGLWLRWGVGKNFKCWRTRSVMHGAKLPNGRTNSKSSEPAGKPGS